MGDYVRWSKVLIVSVLEGANMTRTGCMFFIYLFQVVETRQSAKYAIDKIIHSDRIILMRVLFIRAFCFNGEMHLNFFSPFIAQPYVQ